MPPTIWRNVKMSLTKPSSVTQEQADEKLEAIFKYLKLYVPHNFPYAFNCHWELARKRDTRERLSIVR